MPRGAGADERIVRARERDRCTAPSARRRASRGRHHESLAHESPHDDDGALGVEPGRLARRRRRRPRASRRTAGSASIGSDSVFARATMRTRSSTVVDAHRQRGAPAHGRRRVQRRERVERRERRDRLGAGVAARTGRASTAAGREASVVLRASRRAHCTVSRDDRARAASGSRRSMPSGSDARSSALSPTWREQRVDDVGVRVRRHADGEVHRRRAERGRRVDPPARQVERVARPQHGVDRRLARRRARHGGAVLGPTAGRAADRRAPGAWMRQCFSPAICSTNTSCVS